MTSRADLPSNSDTVLDLGGAKALAGGRQQLGVRSSAEISKIGGRRPENPEPVLVSSESGSCSRQPKTNPSPRFITLFDMPNKPRDALPDMGGILPMRAVRYCDAVTSACGFGWYIYPPVECHLLWDGRTISYSLDGCETFQPIDDMVPFPGLSERLAEVAPFDVGGLAPGMFSVPPERSGSLQINLALIAMTEPGWSLLLRRPPNLHIHDAWDTFEGIVATDRWRGPLFTNIVLRRTHQPIHLDPNFPIVQAQPIPREAYARDTMTDYRTSTLEEMTAKGWAEWHRTFVEPNDRPNRRDGEYSVAERRRMKGRCPHG